MCACKNKIGKNDDNAKNRIWDDDNFIISLPSTVQ